MTSRGADLGWVVDLVGRMVDLYLAIGMSEGLLLKGKLWLTLYLQDSTCLIDVKGVSACHVQ